MLEDKSLDFKAGKLEEMEKKEDHHSLWSDAVILCYSTFWQYVVLSFMSRFIKFKLEDRQGVRCL
jgi:hypothetical protein